MQARETRNQSPAAREVVHVTAHQAKCRSGEVGEGSTGDVDELATGVCEIIAARNPMNS